MFLNFDPLSLAGQSLTVVSWPRTMRENRIGRNRNILAEAIEDGALGFMAKVLVQTTLPHRAVSGTRYVRTDGNLSLSINDVGGTGIPYGSYPRLILIWMTTEAVRTKRRELVLGRSLSSFMAQLGLHATGGHWGTISRFRNQRERLLGCAISTRWSSRTNSEF